MGYPPFVQLSMIKCYLYEQKKHFTLPGEKELFTLPGIINIFTEHSELTPFLTLQHGGPFSRSTLHDTSMKRRSSSHYQVSSTPSLSTATSPPSHTAAWGTSPCSTFHDRCMKRRSSSHYQVSGTPSLSTANSLSSHHCSMGSFPCSTLHDRCMKRRSSSHYQVSGTPSLSSANSLKELFTLPGIINTFTEHRDLPLFNYRASPALAISNIPTL